MTGKHPDSPSDRSLSDEVNPQTREAYLGELET
jgi:hypothetical protein